MKKLLMTSAAAATVVALVSAQASAADLYTPPPVETMPAPEPAFSWTGAYAGVHVGYGWAVAKTDDVEGFDLKPDGVLGGIQAGYNYQMLNRIVVGVEGDIAAADLEAHEQVVNVIGPDTAITSNSHFRVSAFATVRARLGYAFDRILPYVTGGFAWARTEMDYEQQLTISGVPSTLSELHHSKSRTGWVIGGGVEYAFADQVSAKIEYQYADFGKADYPGVAFGTLSLRQAPAWKCALSS